MKMRYNFNETLKANVRKYIDIRNKGYYADATALTNDYNKVMGTKRSITHCGSCLRNMVNELETALKTYEAWEAQEALKALGGYKSAEDKRQAELSGFTSPDEFYAELAMLKEQMEDVAQEIGLPKDEVNETPEKEEETPAENPEPVNDGEKPAEPDDETPEKEEETPAENPEPVNDGEKPAEPDDETPEKEETPDETPAKVEDLTIDFVEEPEKKPSKNSGRK